MNYTQNLRLPQWEGSDRIHHEDFNEAFDKIDEAIAVCPHVEIGSYVGTGTYGEDNPNTLTFSFAPKVVVITEMSKFNFPGYSNLLKNNWFFYRGTETLTGMYPNGSTARPGTLYLDWEGNRFSWYVNANAAAQFNTNGSTYCYLAIG